MSFPLTQILEQIRGRRVLVIGDVMADEYVVGDASRISQEAPVPVLRFSGQHMTLGGAANTAANVASLGGIPTLVGLVGLDGAGEDVGLKCAAAGITLVPLSDGRPTTRKVRIISQQQQLLRIDYEVATSVDAAVERALADACAAHVRQADAVIVSDYAKGLLTHHGCREVIAQAHAAGKSVLVDPRPQHVAFYDACDVITPNWKESLGLAGEADAEATPANIARVGAAVSRRLGCDVLLTLGAQGMAYFSRDGGEALRVPAIRQEVFDVSGAGDTVAAAFALARAGGCDAAAAVSFANRAAAVVVGKRGTATVTPAELLAAAP